MNIPRQTTPTPQKRPHASRAGGMASRLRGNDGVCLAVNYYQNSSCLGNKYADYKHTFDIKTPPITSSAINGQAVTPQASQASQANQAAQVSDRYFLIPEVPLQIGANTLRITATDHLGNARSQDIQVSRIAAGSDRLTLLGGNRQSAAVNTELAKPLSIIALNAAGEPLANLPINFDIMRGTGAISTSQGIPVKTNGLTAARNLIVNTDSNGKAQVWLTVGKQTGPGANVVKASHVKFGEEVTFTASTQRGAVFKISADLGTNQIAETNAQPLELLSAVVRDAQDNLLPNIPVVLTIEAGDASFPDSTGAQATAYASGPLPDKAAQRIVLNTDKNGLVALRPLIGNLEGTVRIKAQALKAETGNVNTASDPTAGGSNWIGNATFLIQAKEAKDGPASFKGYVYDDKSRPLANVKISIGRTASVSTTDANGLFQLDNIPPGRIDLFVDGRTVNPTNDVTKPQYPSLHFEAYAIKGRDNQIAHPIYLPPLSTSPDSVKTVGGSEDVILKIPGLAGFQMKVKANSVTFPDGSRVGTLIVSPVTADKLPMAPPAGGAQFGVPAWTVQPAGTRFDPPIEVTLPNASSQPAGDNLPIVQWDHDLGQYVAMGRATVSEDGSVLITDSGSGITKAGWGGLCRYDPDKCGKNAPPKCAECEQLLTGRSDCPTCYPDPSKNAIKCESDVCKTCQNGACKADKDKDDTVTASVTAVKLSFSTLLERGPVIKISQFFGINSTLNAIGEISAAGDDVCCAKAKTGHATKYVLSGALTLETQAEIPLLPVIRKIPFSEFVPGIGLLPSVKIKFSVSGSGNGEYNGCKAENGEKAGSANGKLTGGLEVDFLSLSEKWSVKYTGVGGGKKTEYSEITLLEIGATGQADVSLTDWPVQALEGEYGYKIAMFIRLPQITTPLGGVLTLGEYSFPIAQSTPGQGFACPMVNGQLSGDCVTK
jgi:hypothetical protein